MDKSFRPYDLGAAYFCEECGRPKYNRLLMTAWTPLSATATTWRRPTGCATCDAVISAHRCTQRPRLEDLCDGDQWKCPGCGLVWHATVEIVVTEERSWSTSRDADDNVAGEQR